MNKVAFVLAASAVAGQVVASEPIPAFSLKGTDGKTYTQSNLGAKPTLLVFINLSCPHSRKAAGDLNRISAEIGVRVLGIINADPKTASKFKKEVRYAFPLVADSKGAAIAKMGGGRSLDMAVIAGRKIEQVFVGYKRESLAQMAALFAKAGAKPKLTLASYPEALQSGCMF